MENAPQIFAAMNGVMKEIGAIAKSQFNSGQKFNFRGIDDVMNKLHPLLAKYHLFLIPEVLEHVREKLQNASSCATTSVVRVRYTLFAEDGSSISGIVSGEGRDNGDKASNKALASAMKYFLFQTFCIPTEEMAECDPDRYSAEETALKPDACASCGKPINDHTRPDGSIVATAEEIAKGTQKTYGRCLCWSCSQKARASAS